MAALPAQPHQDSRTVTAIYQLLKAKEDRRRRRYLGGSIIGKECDRALWYDFRWAAREDFDGRMLRLFQSGNLAEIRFVHELRDIGCEVMDVDPDTKEQFEFSAVSGHFMIHIDGAVLGLPEAPTAWHVCEFKTHNAKSFPDLKVHGMATSRPQHLAQLLTGMYLSGMERGFYLAVNKDTDELYSERIRIEDHRDTAKTLIERAERIIASPIPLPRIADNADDFRCRFCAHKEHCHGTSVPLVTCRSCVHATPVIEANGAGRWVCERHNQTLSVTEQEAACEDHLFVPDMLAFAALVDGGEYEDGIGYIEYRSGPDENMWRNGRATGNYRSIELTQLPIEAIGTSSVDNVKRELGGVVVGADQIPF